MKTKEEQKQFILDTLLPYKKNPSLCAYENKQCKYLTSDGRKCAVGKWMKEGKWQSSEKTIKGLCKIYDISEILKKNAVNMGFSIGVWRRIQDIHDTISTSKDLVREVEMLELETGLVLDELKN